MPRPPRKKVTHKLDWIKDSPKFRVSNDLLADFESSRKKSKFWDAGLDELRKISEINSLTSLRILLLNSERYGTLDLLLSIVRIVKLKEFNKYIPYVIKKFLKLGLKSELYLKALKELIKDEPAVVFEFLNLLRATKDKETILLILEVLFASKDELILRRLNTYLESNSYEIKASAIKVLTNISPLRGLEYILRGLLESKSPNFKIELLRSVSLFMNSSVSQEEKRKLVILLIDYGKTMLIDKKEPTFLRKLYSLLIYNKNIQKIINSLPKGQRDKYYKLLRGIEKIKP